MMLLIFSVVGILFNVRSTMEKPEELKEILRTNLTIGVFLALTLGFVSYFAFGSSLNSNILLDLPFSENQLYVLVLFFFCVSLAFTFPLNLLPCLNILEDAIIPKTEYNPLP